MYIDGSFIKDILNDKIDREVVRLINDFCHTVGVTRIDEYVESDDIYQAVKDTDIDYAQGYSIGYPELMETMVDDTEM